MSVFTVDDLPPYAPGPDVLDEAHPRLREPDPLFRTAVDPALRDRCPATPETVHIAPKRRAA